MSSEAGSVWPEAASGSRSDCAGLSPVPGVKGLAAAANLAAGLWEPAPYSLPAGTPATTNRMDGTGAKLDPVVTPYGATLSYRVKTD